ncbi:hypothetical protein EVAR_60284_1 [Eumeta japonica]|uniref:Uncharacterized protein n=1 Tax=Eumeta variegata TaxID=151549 RepID=A0A4C1ZC75_EUMVA|nr:hypothetical protein EVAR_60284_1 [Eumeta japonica]
MAAPVRGPPSAVAPVSIYHQVAHAGDGRDRCCSLPSRGYFVRNDSFIGLVRYGVPPSAGPPVCCLLTVMPGVCFCFASVMWIDSDVFTIINVTVILTVKPVPWR